MVLPWIHWLKWKLLFILHYNSFLSGLELCLSFKIRSLIFGLTWVIRVRKQFLFPLLSARYSLSYPFALVVETLFVACIIKIAKHTGSWQCVKHFEENSWGGRFFSKRYDWMYGDSSLSCMTSSIRFYPKFIVFWYSLWPELVSWNKMLFPEETSLT